MAEYRVALVGATGLIGRTVLGILEARRFPVKSLRLYASPKSAGRTLSFQGLPHEVEALSDKAIEGFDIVILAAGSAVAEHYARRFQAAGALVIDNSSFFRMDPSVPLILPEVNPEALSRAKDAFRKKEGILIANPNCATTTALLPLALMHRLYGLAFLEVTTLQSVAGSGQGGLDALSYERTHEGRYPKSPYGQRIEGNVYPLIDTRLESGETKEERKVALETRKILNLPELPVNATCVRVPVAYGHTACVSVKFERAVSLPALEAEIRRRPDLRLCEDTPEGLISPLQFGFGTDETFIGRLRLHRAYGSYGLSFVCLSDSTRKGAALNNVHILEAMTRNGG